MLGVVFLVIIIASGGALSSEVGAAPNVDPPRKVVGSTPSVTRPAPGTDTTQAVTRLRKAREEVQRALGNVKSLLRKKEQEKGIIDQQVVELQKKIGLARTKAAFLSSQIRQLREEVTKASKADVEKVTVQVTISGGKTVTRELSLKDAEALRGLLK